MKLFSFLLFLVLTVTYIMTGCVDPEVIKQPQVSLQPEIKAEMPLNLFESASAKSTVLQNIPEGEVLERIETKGKWNKVKTSSGKQGWVYMFSGWDKQDFVGSLGSGPIDEVERLLDMGMSMYAVPSMNHALPFVLTIGSKNVRNEMALMLIDKGAEVNVRGMHDDTPLHLAAWHCGITKPEVVKSLLAAGADVNAISTRISSGREEFWTPIMWVDYKLGYSILEGRENCAEIRKILLGAGADTTIKKYRD